MDDNHDAMPNAKGKGKEAAPANDDGGHSQQPIDSSALADGTFVSRIASSASQLSRAVLTGRPEIPHGETSGKTSSGPSSTPRIAHQEQTASYLGQRSVAPNAGVAFAQSRHSSTAGEHQYGDFMSAQAGLGVGSQQSSVVQLEPGLRSAVSDQEARDGQQVVDLLNNPGELDDYDELNDNAEPFLTSQEESALREALFNTNRNKANWAALLDFQPDFLQGHSDVAQLRQHFGDVDPQQARASWMDSWNEVLASYTDEVWGDLGSLARKAQKEVEQGQGTPAGAEHPGDMKALQRLRQILAHVRGNVN